MNASIHNFPQAGRMTEAEYERERQHLHALYGENSKEAAAKRDQAMALLFAASGWTQEQLAAKENKNQSWVARRLRFGQFLLFMPAGINPENLPSDLSEWTFRRFWERTDKSPNDRERFMQVYRLIEAEAALREAHVSVRRNNRPKIGQAIVDGFADGAWHALETIAKGLGTDEEHVAATLKTMAALRTYGVEKVEARPYRASQQYRIFRAGRSVAADEIRTKLDPLVKGLEAEGKKNMATMSPGTVAHLAALIRQLVKEWTE